jgi:hypothetical protein
LFKSSNWFGSFAWKKPIVTQQMKRPLTVTTATSGDNTRRYKSQYVSGIDRIEELKNDL